jgi:hypothetical protein
LLISRGSINIHRAKNADALFESTRCGKFFFYIVDSISLIALLLIAINIGDFYGLNLK